MDDTSRDANGGMALAPGTKVEGTGLLRGRVWGTGLRHGLWGYLGAFHNGALDPAAPLRIHTKIVTPTGAATALRAAARSLRSLNRLQSV